MNTLELRRSGRRGVRLWAALRAAGRTSGFGGRLDDRRVHCFKEHSGFSDLGIPAVRYDGLAALAAAAQVRES